MILRPKLLIATDSFLPRWDGISRFLLDILPVLVNKFDITILCPKFNEELKLDQRLRIIRLPIRSSRQGNYNKVNTKPISKIIEDSNLIFVQSLGPIGKTCIEEANKIKKPVIANVHSLYWEILSKNRFLEPILRMFYLFEAKKIYKKCSLIIVPSIHTAKILEREGIKTPKVVINAGIDTDKFAPAKNKENAKEFVGIDNTRKVIGYVGRLGKEKDLMTLYDAFKRLEARHNNLFLLIIGKGNRKLERVLKKEENIRLIKSTNKIVPYLQAMDIFVMPSLTEVSSIATLEAMSCALPVLTTKVGDLVKYIKDKENGLFFSKKNSVLLMLKLGWLLREDYVRNNIGLNARETVQNTFKLEDTRKKVKRVLEGF